MEWSPFYSLREDNIDKTDRMVELLSGLGYRFYRIRHEDFSIDQGLPALTPLADKAALYATPHNDVLVSKDPDDFVAGWSNRFVPLT